MRISDWSSDVCSSDLHDVERKDRVGQRVDDPVLEHEARAVMAFLARLEHEHHSAGQTVAGGAEQLRRADEHRDMRVVSSEERRVGKEWFSKCISRWSTVS